jgi:hypothetical protein
MADASSSSRAFHALALVAAARTAAHASRAVADRRAGRDASGQQAEDPARAGLAEAVADLRLLLVRLRVRLASGTPADETAALVQTFEGRLVLDDVARAARRAHQTLLSLYPGVDAEMAEGARRLSLDAALLATADAPDAASLAERLAGWLDGAAE